MRKLDTFLAHNCSTERVWQSIFSNCKYLPAGELQLTCVRVLGGPFGKMIFESFVKSQELPVLCISAGLCETTVALTQKSEYASDDPNEVEARFDDNPSITINPPGPPEVDFKKTPQFEEDQTLQVPAWNTFLEEGSVNDDGFDEPSIAVPEAALAATQDQKVTSQLRSRSEDAVLVNLIQSHMASHPATASAPIAPAHAAPRKLATPVPKPYFKAHHHFTEACGACQFVISSLEEYFKNTRTARAMITGVVSLCDRCKNPAETAACEQLMKNHGYKMYQIFLAKVRSSVACPKMALCHEQYFLPSPHYIPSLTSPPTYEQ